MHMTDLDPSGPSGRPAEILDRLDEALIGIRRVFLGDQYRKRLLNVLSARLSLASLRLLRAIERSAGPPSVGDIAEALAIDPSTASRLVDGAVDSDLVHRRSGIKDRRSRSLHLTMKGESLLAEVTARRRELLAQVTDGWESGDLIRLAEMLSTLRAAFDDLELQ